jgi:hypothetical protein
MSNVNVFTCMYHTSGSTRVHDPWVCEKKDSRITFWAEQGKAVESNNQEQRAAANGGAKTQKVQNGRRMTHRAEYTVANSPDGVRGGAL